MHHDIVVIGGSSGSIETLFKLLPAIDPEIQASIFIVIHMSPSGPGLLPPMLQRATTLPVKTAADGEEFRKGAIYFPPPNFHLRLTGSNISLSSGPVENNARPSIDVLFRSAAVNYGRRVIGVVLSGMLNDGSNGLHAIKLCGGIAVVQDPKDALYPEMPQRALESADVDHTVPLGEIGPLLNRLVVTSGGPPVTPPPELIFEDQATEFGVAARATAIPSEGHYAEPVGMSCPDCGGPLVYAGVSGEQSFRCLVGHKYTAEYLLKGQGQVFERSLWVAARVMRERAALYKNMARDARAKDRMRIATDFEKKAEEADIHSDNIRKLLVGARSQAQISDAA